MLKTVTDYFRAAHYALSYRLCTHQFEGQYMVNVHGEPGWEPKGDPVLYTLYPKRTVWAEALPLDEANYRVQVREIRDGYRSIHVGWKAEEKISAVIWKERQIFSADEVRALLSVYEGQFQKEGMNGKLHVRPNWLFDTRHFRRFVP